MIHVAIDARLTDQGQGGVQQVIRSLAEGFQLTHDAEIRRSWIVYKGASWWDGIFPPDDNIILINPPFGKNSLRVANHFPKLISLVYPIIARRVSHKTPFDIKLKDLNVDIVHMLFQDGFETDIPFIYHPHDLQHRYLPENFNKFQIAHREVVWKSLASRAVMVMAANARVSADLQTFWGISPDRIAVMLMPPPSRKQVPDLNINKNETPYIMYPAVFWPHKNHEVIVNAMQLVVESGTNLSCIFAGAAGTNLKKIKRLVRKLKLKSHISFLGHVPDDSFAELLHNAEAVVIPSLYEASSLTVYDSLNSGKQVLCSDIQVFREQCGNDVIFFDPFDASDLYAKICSFVISKEHDSQPNIDPIRKTVVPIPTDAANMLFSIYKSVLHQKT